MAMAKHSSLFVLLAMFILFVQQGTLVSGFMAEDGKINLEELDSHLATFRLKRSVDGPTTAPCSKSGGVLSIYQPQPESPNGPILVPDLVDSCVANGLPLTRCNQNTGYCECDPFVATRLRVSTEAQLCVPLAYVNESQGRCLNTAPDMCSVLVSGSVCRSVPPPNPQFGGPVTPGLRCVCQFGGVWPNCTPRLGSPCQNTTVCQFKIPNSYCANINPSTGFGNCSCPRANQPLGVGGFLLNADNTPNTQQTLLPPYTQNTFANSPRDTSCVPTTCPPNWVAPSTPRPVGQIYPCSEDNRTPGIQTADCRNTASGYQCTCRPEAKGRAHNSTTPGRCCTSEHLVCNDFSACFLPTEICDGVAACANCYDESALFQCNTAWPAQCGPVPAGRTAGSPASFAQLAMNSNVDLVGNKLKLPSDTQISGAVQSRAPSAQAAVSGDNNQVQSSSGNAFQGFSFVNDGANSFGPRNFKVETP